MMYKIEKTLFYLLILVVPANLGKHLTYSWNYLQGFLVDYSVPAIYLQDILIVLLLILWLYKIIRHNIKLEDLGWNSRLIFIFIFTLFLSSLISINIYASFYSLLRIFLYIMFSFYVAYNFNSKDFPDFIKVLSISLLFLELLAIAQWFKQGSLFNNYLFFGEQPYGFSTLGIVKESLFGKSVVPAYGTFRHPNILGGYLSVTLLWVYYYVNGTHHIKFKSFYYLVIALGVVALFLTFSLSALLVFSIGIVTYYSIKRWHVKRNFILFMVGLLSVLIITVTFAFFKSTSVAPSIYRRAFLNEQAILSSANNLLFGTGHNTSYYLSTVSIDYLTQFGSPQPVHNIYLLILVEGGIFAFIAFIIFFGFALKNTSKMLFVSFIQLFILGLFDHYLFTIHQGLLLLWLTVGFHMSYTLSNVQQD